MTPLHSRRRILMQLGAGAAALSVVRLFEPGVFAEELEKHRRTPAMTEGPFYPDHLPLDTDNDLLVVNNAITPAVGDVTHLTGKILDSHGSPVRNAIVEIWQCDNTGAYLHSRGSPTGKRDLNFQGYGRFMTSSSGEYYFRTIKPVPYPGRTPHIHFKVVVKGKTQLITQCFINGNPQNDRDGIYRHVDAKSRDLVNVDFKPIKDSKIGELAANFDMLLGYTPEG